MSAGTTKGEKKMTNGHDERSCWCGRVAVARYGQCLEHLSAPEVDARENETRNELREIADTARLKQALGEDLNAREREVLESFRVLEERFGGKYPPPCPRPGITFMDKAGNIIDPRELSEHFRVSRKNSGKNFGILFENGVVVV